MKWFVNCETIEDVKARYKKLVFEYHPDVSGKDTTAIMQEINNEYTQAAKKFKNIHKNAQGEKYEKETKLNEFSRDTSEQFREIINRIIHFENVIIEICGSWIWLSGNTKEYKEIIKELKFKWSSNKSAWYFHTEPFRKKGDYKTMDEIREMYGSEKVENEPQAKIRA